MIEPETIEHGDRDNYRERKQYLALLEPQGPELLKAQEKGGPYREQKDHDIQADQKEPFYASGQIDKGCRYHHPHENRAKLSILFMALCALLGLALPLPVPAPTQAVASTPHRLPQLRTAGVCSRTMPAVSAIPC